MSDENRYDLTRRLYGATAYTHYAHLITATKTVVTVQDFTTPQVLQFRRTVVYGPDITTPNLLQFRRTAVIGPQPDAPVLKQARFMVVALPPTEYASVKTVASTTLTTLPDESAHLVSIKRYSLYGILADAAHLVSTTLTDLATWVPDTVTCKMPAVTTLSTQDTDSAHVVALRRYMLYSTLNNSIHQLSTAINTLMTEDPDDLSVKSTTVTALNSKLTDIANVVALRRYVLYAPVVNIAATTMSFTTLNTIFTNSVALLQTHTTQINTVSPDAHLVQFRRYTLYGNIPNTIATTTLSTTTLDTALPPAKIRRRFSYMA